MLASSLAVTPCTLPRCTSDHVKLMLMVYSCIDGPACCRCKETNAHLDTTWISKGCKRELGGGAQTPAARLHPGGWCGIPTSTRRRREEARKRGGSDIWWCCRRYILLHLGDLKCRLTEISSTRDRSWTSPPPPSWTQPLPWPRRTCCRKTAHQA